MEIATLMAGGIIGFLASIGKDYINEKNKNQIKQKDFKREKLEDVFILLSKIYENTFKEINDVDPSEKIGNKLRMLIQFYFPNLFDDYQRFANTYTSVTDNTFNRPKILATKRDLEFEYAVFKNIIIKESEKYI